MGRMKSLGYAYAEHLGDGVDVDWYFESIVNGEIEIPKWFVEEWIEANPIFAAETFDAQLYPRTKTGKRGICEVEGCYGQAVMRTDDGCRCASIQGFWRCANHHPGHDGIYVVTGQTLRNMGWDGFSPLPNVERGFGAENSEDYEVIMTNIGHTMERDGETIVFGDVMFGLPNNGRSRISSYGQGADKASARQALIDRAIEHLQREEFNAETFSSEYQHCDACEEVRSIDDFSLSNDSEQTLTEGEVCDYCFGDFYDAETKSWRMQNRDSKGRFTKGFVEEIDIGQFMEMDPEEIPLMPPITYTPEQVVEFINDCINMDNFPEQLMNSGFLDTLQQVTASADLELLEGLSDAAHTSLIENGIYDDRAGMAAAKRAIFVTDVFLNFKWGQENWAAEDY